MGEGDFFGERALLTGEPRAANVTALEDVNTLCLSRNRFEEVVGPFQTIVERRMKKHFLMGIPLFAGSKFTEVELDHIADITREACYKKGYVLAEIGKPVPQDLCIIRSGRVLVLSEKEETIHNLLTGDYFGDKAIKAPEGTIGQHGVIMEEDTTCWILSRKELEDVIGDIDRLSDCYMPFMISQVNKSIRLKDVKKHRMLGMGAFGKVWLVSHSGEPYAMKMLDKLHLIEGEQVTSCLREKNIMQSLHHPFLLGMISSFQDQYNVYLLLPLVQCGELFNVIHTDTRDGLPNAEACFYAACVLDALGYLHVRNICYRDLKPENILVDEKGYCVVIDMGFAKLVANKTYTLCGTPGKQPQMLFASLLLDVTSHSLYCPKSILPLK
jgi:CRP-like cAMP-binding protein